MGVRSHDTYVRPISPAACGGQEPATPGHRVQCGIWITTIYLPQLSPGIHLPSGEFIARHVNHYITEMLDRNQQ